MPKKLLHLIFRVAVIWFVIMVVESVHGILRGLFLAPYVGDLRAKQIGVFVGSLIVLTVTFVFIRWLGVRSWRKLLAVGLIWVYLTLTFEVILGIFVFDLSWATIVADYDIFQGGLMSFGLLIMLLAPLIAIKLKRHCIKLNGASYSQ